jgi:hypothetical protein
VTPHRAIVLDVLVGEAEFLAGLPVPSYLHDDYKDGTGLGTLCALTGLHRRTVRRVLDALVAEGSVVRTPRGTAERRGGDGFHYRLVEGAPLLSSVDGSAPWRSSYVLSRLFRRCWQTSDGPLGCEGEL